MEIKEFPNVKVEKMKSGLNSESLIRELSFSTNESTYALYAICELIENKGRFIGTNAESYAESIRDSNLLSMDSAPYKMESSIYTSEEFLDSIINEFSPRSLAYAVIEREGRLNEVESIIKEPAALREFLRNGYSDYAPKRVERAIIVPSEKLTDLVWGFTYNIKDLERMVSYRV
ncbi:MAG: hypothetical protein NTV63_05470 [Candidatus Woesearchaeota archaeon]|nr:hypothetical protein [Candidatus Woesearchaeota archaeon]